jgi:hypothetical protein
MMVIQLRQYLNLDLAIRARVQQSIDRGQICLKAQIHHTAAHRDDQAAIGGWRALIRRLIRALILALAHAGS